MPAHGNVCHDHDCSEGDCGLLFSLHRYVDIPRVRCLNEAVEGSCQAVFKPWDQRTDFSGQPLDSDEGDPELLLHIPFDGEIKLKAMSIIGGPGGTSPASVKLYTNRDNLDFETVHDIPAVQEFVLNEDFTGVLEYPVNVAKFNNVHSLDMYFPACLGADHTTIFFVGLKGEFTERKREVVHAVYELKPMADASKVPGTEGNSFGMGM